MRRAPVSRWGGVAFTLAVLLPWLLAGCGGGAMGDAFTGAGGSGGQPCDGGGTVSFGFSPAVLQRGAAVNLNVSWELRAEIRLPQATITSADDTVEVDVSLERDATGPNVSYSGTLLNPFGAGTPGGSASVLGHAQNWPDCAYSPVATTGFLLE